jgi:hypothetical protein
MPALDMEIISAVFAGAVIREGFGKLVAIRLRVLWVADFPCHPTIGELLDMAIYSI